MPEQPELSAEDFDHRAAHAILGKFLAGDDDKVRELFDEIGDPLVAAAVTIRLCLELDPGEIALLLTILEEEDPEEEGGEEEPGEDPED